MFNLKRLPPLTSTGVSVPILTIPRVQETNSSFNPRPKARGIIGTLKVNIAVTHRLAGGLYGLLRIENVVGEGDVGRYISYPPEPTEGESNIFLPSLTYLRAHPRDQ